MSRTRSQREYDQYTQVSEMYSPKCSISSNSPALAVSAWVNVVKAYFINTLVVFTLLGSSSALVSAANSHSSDSQINIIKGEAVKISGIDDWFIGVFGATDSINSLQYQWDYECVYSSSGAYQVEVISQIGDNPLNLENSSGDKMRYEIWTYYRRGNRYRLAGPYSTPSFTLTNLKASQSLTCSDQAFGGNNLFFAAVVRPAPFNAAPPGIYNDQVTLIVTPE